jgi:Leucine-rich repeat (LRR) protein
MPSNKLPELARNLVRPSRRQQLEELPEALGQLTTLRDLNVSSSRLSPLPASLASLRKALPACEIKAE